MLTGNIRYRKNWRGKIILQVEEKLHHIQDLNGSGYYDEWTTIKFRDARITDFNETLTLKV